MIGFLGTNKASSKPQMSLLSIFYLQSDCSPMWSVEQRISYVIRVRCNIGCEICPLGCKQAEIVDFQGKSLWV